MALANVNEGGASGRLAWLARLGTGSCAVSTERKLVAARPKIGKWRGERANHRIYTSHELTIFAILRYLTAMRYPEYHKTVRM